MRYATGSFTTAAVLFVAGAVGAVGSWALPVSAVALFAAAIVGAIAMEEGDVRLSPTPLPAQRAVSRMSTTNTMVSDPLIDPSGEPSG